MLLGSLPQRGGRNVAIHPGDARDIFDVAARGVRLDRAFCALIPILGPRLRPSPAPVRGRLNTLNLLLRCSSPGAIFRVATDIEDYVRQTP